ncbi:MAG: hypothetical protein JNM44_05215 [Chitinophagaceae bacterium]|nr:hypothetical protein [Chitinophagaceae bacterium]
MKRLLIVFGLFAGFTNNLQAQDEIDAIRYGFQTYSGTARGMGIGGALGSIGGDFSTLSVNPAGLGIYRSSEFSISPSFQVANNRTEYTGVQASGNSSKFNLGSFGLVLTRAKTGKAYRKSGWKAASFAFGMNRQATYKNEYEYGGKNNTSSLIERFAEEYNRLGGLNTTTLGQVSYPAYAAYQTYLIDRGMGTDSNLAYSYIPYSDGLMQYKSVVEKGHIQEYVISVGGNYMEKLMVGATLGLQSLQYNRTLKYSEDDLSGKTDNEFRYFDFREDLETEGTGVNLKLGAILKPIQQLRIGVALHTPTHIEMNDASSIYMESHTDSLLLYNNPGASAITQYQQDSLLIFNYSLTTPYRALGSFAVLFNQNGFLTADIEYVGYTSMKYNYKGFDQEEDAVNQVIRNTYKNALNVRVGAELKLEELGIRAGFAYYGSPYKNSQLNASRMQFSGGLGYRTKFWFLDIAYIFSKQNLREQPYRLTRATANVPVASTDNRVNQVLCTIGWKF